MYNYELIASLMASVEYHKSVSLLLGMLLLLSLTVIGINWKEINR